MCDRFYLDIDLQKTDTALMVIPYEEILKTTKLLKSYYLCLRVQKDSITSFLPDFEIKTIMSGMDPNLLNSKSQNINNK